MLQLDAAEAAVEAGQLQMANEILTALLVADPNNIGARVLLAKITALDDIPRAVELISGVETVETDHMQVKDAVNTLGHLYKLNQHPEELPQEEGRETYLEAITAVVESNWDKALEMFIKVIQANRYYDDDGARKACIALFSLLGPTNGSTKKHRRMFDMMLY